MNTSFRTLTTLYAPSFPLVVIAAYTKSTSVRGYAQWFFGGAAKDARRSPTNAELWAAAVLLLIAYLQVLAGIGMIVAGLTWDYAGGLTLGTALLLGVPFVSFLLAPFASFATAIRVKPAAKALLCSILEAQVRALRKRQGFTIIAVVGSVGKTSTKLATAQLLERVGARVQYQTGNYNDRLTVPLVVFGRQLPGLFNVFAWLKIILQNARAIHKEYPYDIVVLELGTDGPGQIEQFAYLLPELTIVTAIAPEHMEHFGTLAAVAKEEFAVTGFSDQLLINVSDVPGEYLPKVPFAAYGGAKTAHNYSVTSKSRGLAGQTLTVYKHGKKLLTCDTPFLGEHGAKIVLAAITTADMLEYPVDKIAKAAGQLQPFAGRMQVLAGTQGSTIIDDTYNASPEAVAAALTVLGEATAPQKIAVLGSMNELGKTSKKAHEAIGASIDPAQIDLVVTIGKEAEQYLAPAATTAGNSVVSFLNPHEAGEYVREYTQDGAVVLFKGSQNGVFAEEAIKPLLKNKKDASKLVRQTKGWLKAKRKQFKLPK